VNFLEVILRKTTLLTALCGFFFLASFAHAQQGDASIGFGTIVAPSSSSCSAFTLLCPEKGGLYPDLNLDVIFHKHVGFDFETAWRASQGAYGGSGGQPYRPIILDFNGMYQPKLGKKVGLDLLGGIGFQSTRYYGYTPTTSCVYLGACFQSSHHFLVDVGAGLRYYVWNHVFVRPEVRYYHIVNNDADFTNNDIIRVGASIGYTIGGGTD
jgi:Outer membrane protein beta-barrel domain